MKLFIGWFLILNSLLLGYLCPKIEMSVGLTMFMLAFNLISFVTGIYFISNKE